MVAGPKEPTRWVYLGLTLLVALAQRNAGSLGTLENIPFSARTANELVAYVAYFGKMIWPAQLACFYPHAAYLSQAALASLVEAAVAAGLLLALVTCLVTYFAWRRPYLVLGWFWYVGTLVPVIGLVTVGTSSMADANRGIAHRHLGKPELALADLGRAIEKKPDYLDVYSKRGFVYAQLGQYKSLADFTQAIELRPDYPDAHSSRGISCVHTGPFELALADFTRSIELNPDNPQPYNNLVRLLATCPDSEYRDSKPAVAAARRACELLGWIDFNILDTLATAYAQTGQFAEAVAWQTKAVELAPTGARDQLRQRLQRYEEWVPNQN